MTPKIISVNVGSPRSIQYGDRIVSTGIFKIPVNGRIRVGNLGLEGDGQADLTVHGGPGKAVYAYPSEHYVFWEDELQTMLPYGMFGENLTTEGLLEESVSVGDRFQVGSAELIVTQPRFPCYKLGIKFSRMEIVKQFQASGRSGFYLSVAKEGEVEASDSILLIYHNKVNPTVMDLFSSNFD